VKEGHEAAIDSKLLPFGGGKADDQRTYGHGKAQEGGPNGNLWGENSDIDKVLICTSPSDSPGSRGSAARIV